MDLRFDGHGSIYLLRHITLAGEAWISENIDDDAMRNSDGSVVVHHRYAQGIADGARMDGLVVGVRIVERPW